QISPGIAHSLSRLCPPHICTVFPDRFRALEVHAFLPRLHTSYAIPVRQASVLLTASFRSHLAVSTLAVRLTIPPVGLVRDFHPLVSAPCRANTTKAGCCEHPARLSAPLSRGEKSFDQCQRITTIPPIQPPLFLHPTTQGKSKV